MLLDYHMDMAHNAAQRCPKQVLLSNAKSVQISMSEKIRR